MKKQGTLSNSSPISTRVDELIRKQSKCLKKSQKVICILLAYITLVHIGLKDAYLLDICFLTKDEICQLISAFCQMFSISVHDIIVLDMDVDFFICNRAILSKKLSVADCDPDLSPLLFYLNDSNSWEISDYRANRCTVSPILTVLGGSSVLPHNRRAVTTFTIDTTSPEYQTLGAPMIAGFLLGYPFIYWSSLSGGMVSPYAVMSEKLSFTTLNKLVLSIEINRNEECLLNQLWFTAMNSDSKGKSTPVVDYVTIPILECTYPTQLLDSNPTAVHKTMIERTYAKYESYWNERIENVKDAESKKDGILIAFEHSPLECHTIATETISL